MLPQLRSFLIVIEEGSLNRAATRLRVSQPTLSRQMQALEHEIGGRLLERTSIGVKPTDVAHALAARMRGIIEEFDGAIAEARKMARGERAQLRIGFLGSAAQGFLNPALATLRKKHPEVKVKLLDLSPGEQIAALQAGEIDLALIGQEGSLAARDFYTKKLATLPVLAVLPADHPLASHKTVRLKELKGEQFIGAPEDQMPGRDRWITQLCRRAGFRPNFMQVADSLSRMLSLVAGDGAVTLVPAYMRELPAAGVVMVPVADAGATWDFLVVWQRGRTAGPVAVLLEALSAAVEDACAKAAKKKRPSKRV